ncbi:MAG: hypothetical protein M0T73_10750 [Deltaproteobacteria bacterium]|nr:hypothetical protein [Deltaproteobacteria bacterium]
MKSASYLRNLAFVFITLCIFGATIAFIGDSAHLFHSGYERKIAESLNSNHFVEGVTNYDERLVQKFRLNSLPDGTKLNTIILGSSRTMQISENLFRKRTINLSVSGAGIEDYLALYHLAKRFNPKRVVIGVDPWVFNARNGLVGWKTLSDEFLAESSNLGLCSRPVIKFNEDVWLQLINIKYIKSSLRTNIKERFLAILNGFDRQDLVMTTAENPCPDKDGLRPDGTRIYNSSFSLLSPDQVEASAIQYATPPINLLSGFDRIDENYWGLFKQLISDMAKKSKVVIVLPPFHPSSYKRIIVKVGIIHEVEQKLIKFAADSGLQLIGSYDPEKVGCNKFGFWDGLHPKTVCISKMFGTTNRNVTVFKH